MRQTRIAHFHIIAKINSTSKLYRLGVFYNRDVVQSNAVRGFVYTFANHHPGWRSNILFFSLGKSMLVRKPGYTTGTVSAHFTSIPIRIVEQHVYIRPFSCSTFQEHDTIGTYGHPTLTKFSGNPTHLIFFNFFKAIINNDKVVARPLHFCKLH